MSFSQGLRFGDPKPLNRSVFRLGGWFLMKLGFALGLGFSGV